MLPRKIANLASLGPITITGGFLRPTERIKVATGAGAVTVLGDRELVKVVVCAFPLARPFLFFFAFSSSFLSHLLTSIRKRGTHTVRAIGLGKARNVNMEGHADSEGIRTGKNTTSDGALEVGNIPGIDGAVCDDGGVVFRTRLGEGAHGGENDGDLKGVHLYPVLLYNYL